jgi:adenylosuccinate synthase
VQKIECRKWNGGIVIVGAQYGDEGKGKVVDYLSKDADYVVRFQGGNNAGHTVVVGKETYKLHLLPSGAMYCREIIIGNGVVVDPEVLLKEVSALKERGLVVTFHLSDRAHIIMPYHKILDALHDTNQAELTAGSTRRGIGPAYSDKAARYGIRAVDLLNEEILRKKISNCLGLATKIIRAYNYAYSPDNLKEMFDEEKIVQQYLEFGKKLSPNIKDTSEILYEAFKQNKNVLFEGAQAVMLCVDWGIYPHTTSSNPIAGGVCAGAGVPPSRIKKVIGVVKAYTSRVGHGPLAVEILDDTADIIREKGYEYGTTTGRPRRIGWLDLVVLRHAHKLNDFDSIAVTKLDILTGLKRLRVCTAYNIDGRITNVFPADLEMLRKAKPIYIELEGWSEDISKVRNYKDLPENAKKYLETIESAIGAKISLIGVGAERDDVIVKGEI